MRHLASEKAAQRAARAIRQRLQPSPQTAIGLVLGTGWGNALPLRNRRQCAFTDLPGFKRLGELPGHARQVIVGELLGHPVIALSGRVHLNEAPASPDIYRMTRLQIEMLLQLGVKRLILTCAVGGLSPFAKVGHIGFIYGLMTLFAPDMPLYAGEFCSPEDVLDVHWCRSAKRAAVMANVSDDCLFLGTHAMVRGPFFEGRHLDKGVLMASGADVVGMSVLPELCVAALYPEVKALPLAFVTNSSTESHSHEENLDRAKCSSAALGVLLEAIVKATAEDL